MQPEFLSEREGEAGGAREQGGSVTRTAAEAKLAGAPPPQVSAGHDWATSSAAPNFPVHTHAGLRMGFDYGVFARLQVSCWLTWG